MVTDILRRIARELRDGFLAYGQAMNPAVVPVAPAVTEEAAVVQAAIRILCDAADSTVPGPARRPTAIFHRPGSTNDDPSVRHLHSAPEAALTVEDYLRRLAG